MSNLFCRFSSLILFKLSVVFMLVGVQDLSAQELALIKGKVTAQSDGEVLVGVNITVKGSQGGTISNVDGAYSIRITRGSTLIFSYLGYAKKEVNVGNTNVLNVILKEDAESLAEIVVTGYGGTATRLEQVGSISKVTDEEFKNTTVNTVDQILQGRVAGVNVISTSGEPGADIIVNIRGTNSISGDNQPLYVIDGFPVPPNQEAPVNTSGGNQQNGLFGLNPNDIESIDILKDASATAIYGSRAANGVVLITTKQGKTGEGIVTITNKSGVGFISSPYQMMNSQQYVDIKNIQQLNNNLPAIFNVEDFANRTNTNWLKQISQTSVRQETGFNIRGGSGGTNYFLSGSYLYDKGLLLNSGNNRGNIRFNVNTNVKKWHAIRGTFTATKQNTQVGVTNARGWPSSGGPILNALRAAPLFENNLEFEDVSPDEFEGVVLGSVNNPFLNPVLEQTLKRDNRLNQQIIANLENVFYLDKKRNYEMHLITGASSTNAEREILQPPLISRPNNGSAQMGASRGQSFNTSFFLTQKYKINKHNLNNTIGVEITKNTNITTNATTQDLAYPDLALYNLGSGKLPLVSSSREESTIQSAFARSTYNFSNRYVFSGSLRLDGSSRFAAGKKYGLFPSAGFTWNISEENFVKENITSISLAKLRITYGSTGNDRSLPINRSLLLYGTSQIELGNNQGTSPYIPLSVNQPANPNLVWETTNQFNIATDLGFFNNKLGITFEYYDKLTKDLLQNVPVPAQSGFSRLWANVGTIRNRGLELEINTNQINKKNFTWGSSLNLSRNVTTLVDLGAFDPQANLANVGGNLTASGASHALIPGKQIGLFYGYKIDGLYQPSDFNPDGTVKPGVPVFQGNTADTRVGRLKFANTDGSADNLVNDNDRTEIGNAAPDLILGFTNNLRYKKLSLNLLFTGSLGNDIQNIVAAYGRSGNLQHQGVSFNQTQEWYMNRWTLDNQHNDIRYPAVQSTITVVSPDANSSMIEDGSYVRLKNVTLSYQFGVKRVKFLKALNVYVTGTDLFILTKYSGFDPEVSTFGNNPLLMGIDYGAYPRNRNFTLGLTVGL